ncbi:glycosyl hydrolase 115 family protein [Lacihabitans lacunae]|uniref:Glycosyl hydrolase 115 family protein n=1 Tax=Lacihabitans lacunae TaxID=1028214 RepID=A0ABV7YQQ9_9BACT
MPLKFKLFTFIFFVYSNLSFAQNPKPFALNRNVEIVTADPSNSYSILLADFLTEDTRKVFGTKRKKTLKQKIILRTINEKTTEISDEVFKKIDDSLTGKWEIFSYKNYKTKDIDYLIISGSDARGLAYGVFDLSEKIGVSPWYFWADVPIKTRKSAYSISDTISQTPSVKYRGIFINDEDWGLQPWAAKTFETDKKDIGPKTYAKVFELLLRLKANLIWPAMHPSTKAFYYYPENKEVADKYHIVVGTSHAEPMMRNNVDEWVDSTMGQYNYITNKTKILDYWKQRIDEIKDYENLYSIGMRGKHDSGMEGIKSKEEAVAFTNAIIKDQQNLLAKEMGKPKNTIPQVLTLYKEVLELYKVGLEVPEDVTLIWPDDNYGYIKNLSNATERDRTGGSGVYYHASYWGRPHDYLWISSTNPALMRFEMQKAYELGARNVWVVNVGDIKPLEYPTQLFLDMAYNISPFLKDEPTLSHLQNWTLKNLGNKNIGKILWKNYDLSFVRKPEFMGWSKVEPITKTAPTAFNLSENENRRSDFEELEKQVKKQRPNKKRYKDTYFQLVEYPVLAASKMNQKFLNLDLFYTEKPENRNDQNPNYKKALAAYSDIIKLTKTYNEEISDGKWNHMMSMNPRDLPVFKSPEELKDVAQKTSAAPNQKDIIILAGNYTVISYGASTFWQKISEPSINKHALVSKPFTLEEPLKNNLQNETYVEYELEIPVSGEYDINVQAIPLHPVNSKMGQKIGLQIDEKPSEIIDFETFDRSEEWKENVLSNKTIKGIKLQALEKGPHKIKISMIDPGVLIDAIIVSESK